MTTTRRQLAQTLVSVACIIGLQVTSGCSAEQPHGSPPVSDGETEQQRRVGSLLAEFEHVSQQDTPELEVHAQFIDAQGVPIDRAFDALDVWSSNAQLDRDACSMPVVDNSAVKAATDSEIRLDLLSVGPITVEGPSRRLQLKERRLPALVEAFSGVIYGTSGVPEQSDSSRLDYASGGSYTFRAPGERRAGGFEVTLRAPERVRLTAVSGRAGERADEVHLQRGRDLNIRWNAAAENKSELFFDLETGAGPDAPRLKCRLEDDGQFALPGELLTELASETSTVRMALRRVESKQVDIPRMEHTEFYLSTADRLTLQLQ